MTRLNIELVNIQALKAYPQNARLHSRKQIEQIARSIRAFGFVNPLLIDQDCEVIAGHGRLAAARSLLFTEIPCIRLGSLSAAQKAALSIADNKIALNATWDEDLLAQELGSIANLDAALS